MLKRLRDLDPIIHLVFLIAIVGLMAGFFFLYEKIKLLSSTKTTNPPYVEQVNEISQGRDIENLRDDLKKFLTNAIATIAAVPKSITITQTPNSQERITYLSLGGSFATKNTDWTDITSTDVWINLAEEYGGDAYVDWEAFIKTASSGSKVMVRLYDVTHKIGVNGSDLETNSTTTTRVASGRLYLWQGHNLYRVQIKSLNGIDATFESGRIKVTY